MGRPWKTSATASSPPCSSSWRAAVPAPCSSKSSPKASSALASGSPRSAMRRSRRRCASETRVRQARSATRAKMLTQPAVEVSASARTFSGRRPARPTAEACPMQASASFDSAGGPPASSKPLTNQGNTLEKGYCPVGGQFDGQLDGLFGERLPAAEAVAAEESAARKSEIAVLAAWAAALASRSAGGDNPVVMKCSDTRWHSCRRYTNKGSPSCAASGATAAASSRAGETAWLVNCGAPQWLQNLTRGARTCEHSVQLLPADTSFGARRSRLELFQSSFRQGPTPGSSKVATKEKPRLPCRSARTSAMVAGIQAAADSLHTSTRSATDHSQGPCMLLNKGGRLGSGSGCKGESARAGERQGGG
mmetsp:Transcript_5517/g.20835  ORF Transcript_5517/g.20835 Transcript_5517/m.20835 type:complete len:364 (-) Transcript_5517:6-1097(-)